jgi:hypothetical protein
MVSKNGVEDRDKLTHYGDESYLLWPATDDKLIIESPDRRTAPDCGQAAMYSAARTDVLPPAIVLRPRINPQSRLIGATPTRAAT